MNSSETETEIEELSKVLNKKPNFATIRFEGYDNDKLYQIPIKDIKLKVSNKDGCLVRIPIEPKHNEDYESDLIYSIKWHCPSDCSESHKHYAYYKGRIVNLGRDAKDCETKCNNKRIKFKKHLSELSGTTLSSLDGNEIDMDSLVEPQDAKKLKKEAEKLAGAKILNKNRNLDIDQFMNKRKNLNNHIYDLKKRQCILNENVAVGSIGSKKPKPIIRDITNVTKKVILNSSTTKKLISPLSSTLKENDSRNVNHITSQNDIEQNKRDDLSSEDIGHRQLASPTRNSFERQNPEEDIHPASKDASITNNENGLSFENIDSQSTSPKRNILERQNEEKANFLAAYNFMRSERQCEASAGDLSEEDNALESIETLDNVNDVPKCLTTAILMSHKRRPKKVQYTLPPEKINIAPEGQVYAKVNYGNQVYLGLDIYVDEDVWAKMLRNKKRPTIFLRELAEVIWTPQDLVMRAFDVKLCSAVTPGIKSSRLPFEEDKWQLMIHLYTNYLRDLNKENSKVDVNGYLGKVTEIIRQKIQDLRASLRQAEEKKKYNIVTSTKSARKASHYIEHHSNT